MKELCTPYPDELRLSIGWGNSPQLSMTTKCKTKHTRRHRKSTRKKVQGTRAQRARANITHALAGTGYLPRLTGWQTRKQGQGTRRHGAKHAHRRRDMRYKYPGNGTIRVTFAVPCHDCCAFSIILSMAGLPWVSVAWFIGTCPWGCTRAVTTFTKWLDLRANPPRSCLAGHANSS